MMLETLVHPYAALALASSDGVVVGQWIFNAIVTIALAYIGAKNRQVERLQEEIKAGAKEEIRLQLEPLRSTVESINRQLAKGEGEFKRLVDGDHSLEVKMLKEIAAVRENMITRADLERMRAEWRHDHA